MNKSQEFIRAIGQCDYAYFKEIILQEDQILADQESSSVSYLKYSIMVFKKNPKIFYELIKHPNLYSITDSYLFDLIGKMDSLEFLSLSKFFNFKLIKNKTGQNLANISIKNNNMDLIRYCVENEIQPETDINLEDSWLYFNHKVKNIDSDIAKKIATIIESKYDFGFLSGIFGSSFNNLIYSCISRDFFDNKTEDDFLNSLFNIRSKISRKILYEYVFDRKNNIINYKVIQILWICKSLNVNQSLIFDFIRSNNKYIFPIDIRDFQLLELCLIELKESLSDKKLLQLLQQYINNPGINDSYMDDIKNMHFLIRSNGIKISKRYDSFSELHDKLVRISRKIKQKNFRFEEQVVFYKKMEHIKSSLNKKLESYGLTIYIPLENHELIDLGQDLSICVGSGFYCDRIKNGELLIMSLIDSNGNSRNCISVYGPRWNNQYRYTLGMFRYSSGKVSGLIEQAVGQNNVKIDDELKKIIQEELNILFSDFKWQEQISDF